MKCSYDAASRATLLQIVRARVHLPHWKKLKQMFKHAPAFFKDINILKVCTNRDFKTLSPLRDESKYSLTAANELFGADENNIPRLS